MVTNENITGIILAGGKSSRMGSDKAMLSFKGKRLIEYSIGLMKTLCDNIIISANNSAYHSFGASIVPDNYQGIGALAGLEACLRFSKTRVNLIIPCDTPFLNEEFFNKILLNVKNYDAVVPVLKNGKIEPLTGYYSRQILPAIVQQIEKNNYKVQNLLKILKTKYILIDDYEIVKNINTPDDFRNIEQQDK